MMKNKILRKMVFSAAAVILLTNCAASKDTKIITDMTFNDLTPYPIYVASYEVFTTPATDSIKIPEGFAPHPVKIANDYFNHRFQSAGSKGKLSVVLDQAEIKHHVEQSSNKLGAYIGVDHYDIYNMSMAIKLVVFDVNEYEKKENIIRVHRKISISEHESLAERERLQYTAMDEMMDDIETGVMNVLEQELQAVR